MFKTKLLILLLLMLQLTPLYAKNDVSEKDVVQAIHKGVPAVKKLLKKISIYKLFPEDKTLLHYAVELGNYKVVSFLVEKDILLSQKGGEFYSTALQEAIYYGYPRIANFLIEQGTPVNERDIEGNTALHLAADSGDLDLIQNLLNHGASRDIFNQNGEVPYSLLPALSVDDKEEMETLLSDAPSSSDLSYNDLEFEDELELLHVNLPSHNNRVLQRLNRGNHFRNANIGIHFK